MATEYDNSTDDGRNRDDDDDSSSGSGSSGGGSNRNSSSSSSSSSSSDKTLLHLPPELWILVLSCLTLPETRLMMQVHSLFRNLLQAPMGRRLDTSPDPQDDDDPLDEKNKNKVDTVNRFPSNHGHSYPTGGLTVWNEHVHRLWPSLWPGDNNNYYNYSQPLTQFTHSASQLLAIAQPLPCVMMGVVDHHHASNDYHDPTTTTTTTTTTPSSLSSTTTTFNPPLSSQRTLPRRRRPLMMMHSLPPNPEEEEENHHGSGSNHNHSPPRTNHQSYYQYTGPVGQGDRCIRAKVPLPHVTWTLSKKRKGADPYWQEQDDDNDEEEEENHHHHDAWYSTRGHWHHRQHHPHHQSLFQRFWLRSCTQALVAALSTPPLNWRPFSTPLQQEDGRLVLAPRVVSYFEVSIRAPPPEDDAEDDYYHDYSSRIRAARISSTADCIAVGICTRLFRWKARMPGWDNYSIGYHSDDGGLFFGSGSMQRRYGPQFGPGDTIGCALDHVRRVVFFTHNGRSLGPAVQLARPVVPSSRHTDRSSSSTSSSPPPPPFVVPTAEEWYPVVGLDSNVLVHCNFTGPFVFDLDRYERERYGEMMEQAMKVVPPPVVQM